MTMRHLPLVAAALAIVLTSAPATAIDLAGTWVGSATLTNSWTDAVDPGFGLRCAYAGTLKPPSITITLPRGGGVGRLILDMPAPEGGRCPALRKTYQIHGEISGTRLTIDDPAGNRWTLGLTDDLLSGDVSWDGRAPSRSEALAVGFRYAPPLRPWDVPLTRLTGKVELQRQ
jgi:hypothetical protein